MIRRKLSRRESLIWFAVVVHCVLLAHLLLFSANGGPSSSSRTVIPSIFHGGTPFDDVYGSCLQGADSYAMCNPFLSVKVILVDDQQDSHGYVWLFRDQEREEDALAKGVGLLQEFVRAGESTEDALRRVILQSVDIDIETLPVGRRPLLLGVYSKPPNFNGRDNNGGRGRQQRHIVKAVYIVRIPKAAIQSKSNAFVKAPVQRDIAQKPPLSLADEDLNALSDYMDAALRVGYSWDDATSERRPPSKAEIGLNLARSLC
eukprot:CAMPEP_0178474240 /NCGR_PEP_ID=MMETSP0696-20121128/2501_1 /TAXON_ID=265572 /ORGANISM="Extubocellulus spinifer, Strain CCMP396" /LENGTH=259 /DNA_ID=CAMNT_0020101489 /DNA_START=29 /DNA_END=808 /DNA_ORIENTATION=+